MNLFNALKLYKADCIAFVGAGGKSTTMFRLAREIIDLNQFEESVKTVLVTTTTHLGNWQKSLADTHYCLISPEDIELLVHDLPSGVVMISGGQSNDRLGGLSPEVLDNVRLFAEASHIALLIEADGARMCPLKAPAEHEPAIPNFVDEVIVLSGLSGLGKPLTSEWVHRPEEFAGLSGLSMGETITPQAIASVMVHPQGGLKNIPASVRRVALLNQADTPGLQAQAYRIADQLIPSFNSVIIATLMKNTDPKQSRSDSEAEQAENIYAVVEEVGGIILAAGEGRRFGAPKQLLPWRGKPFIRHVALTALEAGLSPVIVVVGAAAQQVQEAIYDLPVRIVINDDWKLGQSFSIKAGLSDLNEFTGAALFLLADQPHVSIQLIQSLVESHQRTLAPIIAPQIDGKRGNPVLFDSNTFPDLCSLQGDSGGRDLFSRYPIQWVPWHDYRALMDIDTPEEYNRFLEIFPESGENS
jgi:molybdenum cofactor cytidylyltransferase